MKVVGFIAESSKEINNFALALLHEFKQQGIPCGILREKGSNAQSSTLDADMNLADTVAELSSKKLTLSFHEKHSLEDALLFFETEVILVIGFDHEKTFPRILCGRSGKTTSRFLRDQLVLCAYGKEKYWGVRNTKSIKEVAAIIIKNAFKLPNLDCTHCGCETCYAFARAVVSGKRDIKECVSLQPLVQIKIGGNKMPMNPFISDFVEKTVRGMLSALKGSRRGPVTIHLP